LLDIVIDYTVPTTLEAEEIAFEDNWFHGKQSKSVTLKAQLWLDDCRGADRCPLQKTLVPHVHFFLGAPFVGIWTRWHACSAGTQPLVLREATGNLDMSPVFVTVDDAGQFLVTRSYYSGFAAHYTPDGVYMWERLCIPNPSPVTLDWLDTVAPMLAITHPSLQQLDNRTCAEVTKRIADKRADFRQRLQLQKEQLRSRKCRFCDRLLAIECTCRVFTSADTQMDTELV
jgi:hypothetical protein